MNEIDLSYSLGIMDWLLSLGSNPKLGFRTSGSAAEFAAADFLFEEMKRIGLHHVRKEVVPADNFEFKEAIRIVYAKRHFIACIERDKIYKIST